MVANPETSATYEVFSFIDRQNQNHQSIVVTNLLYCLTLQITIHSPEAFKARIVSLC